MNKKLQCPLQCQKNKVNLSVKCVGRLESVSLSVSTVKLSQSLVLIAKHLSCESSVTRNALWECFKMVDGRKTVAFFKSLYIHKLSPKELLYKLRIRVEK